MQGDGQAFGQISQTAEALRRHRHRNPRKIRPKRRQSGKRLLQINGDHQDSVIARDLICRGYLASGMAIGPEASGLRIKDATHLKARQTVYFRDRPATMPVTVTDFPSTVTVNDWPQS